MFFLACIEYMGTDLVKFWFIFIKHTVVSKHLGRYVMEKILIYNFFKTTAIKF